MAPTADAAIKAAKAAAKTFLKTFDDMTRASANVVLVTKELNQVNVI